MAKSLVVIGSLLLLLGGIATFESANGSLRFFPAAILRLHRPFVAGPDLPGYLTNSGVAVVYLVPGFALVALGAILLYRGRSAAALRFDSRDS